MMFAGWTPAILIRPGRLRGRRLGASEGRVRGARGRGPDFGSTSLMERSSSCRGVVRAQPPPLEAVVFRVMLDTLASPDRLHGSTCTSSVASASLQAWCCGRGSVSWSECRTARRRLGDQEPEGKQGDQDQTRDRREEGKTERAHVHQSPGHETAVHRGPKAGFDVFSKQVSRPVQPQRGEPDRRESECPCVEGGRRSELFG